MGDLPGTAAPNACIVRQRRARPVAAAVVEREVPDSMPRNIEVKARIEGVELLTPLVAAIATEGPTEILQDDTFFTCESGWLKLRTFSKEEGEIIFYRRENWQGPRESFYLRSPTSSPDTLREVLSHAYRQTGRVQKHRTFFAVGRTRVHLDRVRHLGHFLELEVVLQDGEPAQAGVREAHDLMARLGVQPCRLVEAAYVDLLSHLQVPVPAGDLL